MKEILERSSKAITGENNTTTCLYVGFRINKICIFKLLYIYFISRFGAPTTGGASPPEAAAGCSSTATYSSRCPRCRCGWRGRRGDPADPGTRWSRNWDDIGKQQQQQQHFDQKASQQQMKAFGGGGTQQQQEDAAPDENAGAGGNFCMVVAFNNRRLYYWIQFKI